VKTRALDAFAGHARRVSSVCVAADGRWLLSGSLDRTLRLWEVATGQCAWTEKTSGAVLSVSLSPDGRWAAAGTYDRKVLVWALEWGA
jgi:WD40 repeat protein